VNRSTLAALQLADSALPIGRFIHSLGLEALLDSDPLLGAEELVELVESVVVHAIGPLDGVAVCAAHAAGEANDLAALLELDRRLAAFKLTPASRAFSTSCGQQLASLALTLVQAPVSLTYFRAVEKGDSPGNLAVVEGVTAQGLGVDRDSAVLIDLRGAAAGLLSAAVRLGRLSAFRAQRALRELEPALAEAATEAVGLSLDELRSFSPELDVYALRHQRAETRVFAT
jgi:urease accessory protein